MAELWALKEGLSLARQLNLTNLNIEIDIVVLVHLLTNLGTINHMLEPLLNDYRNLVKLFPNCSVTHIYKEANCCADKLAKMGATQDIDLLILYEPPHVVDDLLGFDKAELFCNRLIVS